MLYNPPTGSTGPNAPYVGKNTAAGTQGSKVPPAAIEYTQREIVAAIAASGQAPTNGILVQQAMALARGVWVGELTGTGDLAVATLGVVFPTLLQGTRIGAVASATNTVTNPKLRVINVGSAGEAKEYPILLPDGSGPAIGAIKPGRHYRYEADGAGNVMISGGGSDSVAAALAAKVIVGGRYKTFAGPGTYTWTVPDGVFDIRVCAWSPGGGGGAGSNSASGGSGGAGGIYGEDVYAVQPGWVLTAIIGAGGYAGVASSTNPSQGGTGGITAISGPNGALMTLTGGQGGQAGNGGTATALSNTGTAAGATLVRPGYFGGLAYTLQGVVIGGSGGAAHGASQPPVNVAPSGGNPGMFPGGGGSGAAGAAAGGLGANGDLSIEY